MAFLSDDIRRRIEAYIPLPLQAGGHATGLARCSGRVACVPLDAIREIADLLDLSPAEVHDAMSFYGFFRDEHHRLGRRRLWVCRSLACMLRGGEDLLTNLCGKLHLKPGETSQDGKITLEFAECIGACEGASAVLIDDEARLNVTPEAVDALLSELRS